MYNFFSDVVVPSESLSNKGDAPESNISDGNKGNILEKDRIKTDQQPSTSDKDPIRILAGRNRQTQSGPLVAGVVLNHSKSERTRSLERFHHYLYLFH